MGERQSICLSDHSAERLADSPAREESVEVNGRRTRCILPVIITNKIDRAAGHSPEGERGRTARKDSHDVIAGSYPVGNNLEIAVSNNQSGQRGSAPH